MGIVASDLTVGREVPILLLAWRRPEALSQVIAALRPLAPAHLYVACDGPDPTRPGEMERVAATRAVVANAIDWPCTLERRFAETNQGCRRGVTAALDWFFGAVEEGIVLEDDCVPHPDFVPFCAELLERYRFDTRVWSIGGVTFQDGRWRGTGSYYFSRYPHVWGWASWRSRWARYDGALAQWPQLAKADFLERVFDRSAERRTWRRIWQRRYVEGVPDSWAYQWTFSALVHGGLTALPNRPLVTNIGVGEDATHMAAATGLPVVGEGLLPLTHPTQVVRDVAADRYTFDHHYADEFSWRRWAHAMKCAMQRTRT
jgi:hypothetical protein